MVKVLGRLFCIVTMTLAGATAAAGGSLVGGMYSGPAWQGYPMYLYGCLPNRICDDRWQPKRPVAPNPPAFTEQDIWGGSGSPWGYVRRMPPPTAESHIQPRYRDASTIRPEFDKPADPAASR
jgi:hypothetical protein